MAPGRAGRWHESPRRQRFHPIPASRTASPRLTCRHAGTFPARPRSLHRPLERADASELSTAQSFLNDLIALIGADRPDPSHAHGYSFEHPVTFPRTGTPGRIDLYKRGCFVLEAKQGAPAAAADPAQLPLLPDAPPPPARHRGARHPRWDDAMVRARGQAEAYARALPDEYPPFLVTVDVGHVIELFADFSRTGKNYTHFPDATRFRIRLDDLRDPAIRDRLAPRLVRPRRPRPRPHRRPRHPRDRRPPRRARQLLRGRRATPPTASPAS